MKYQLLLAVILLLSGCSAPPKEEVKKKETPSVSFVAVGDNLYHQCMLDEAKTSSGYDFTGYYKNIKKRKIKIISRPVSLQKGGKS